MIYMCLLYVSLGSRVSPSIFGLMFMGSVMLSMCSSSCVLHPTIHIVKLCRNQGMSNNCIPTRECCKTACRGAESRPRHIVNCVPTWVCCTAIS